MSVYRMYRFFLLSIYKIRRGLNQSYSVIENRNEGEMLTD